MSAFIRSKYGVDLIYRSLWQGGVPEVTLTPQPYAESFDTLVLCAQEIQAPGEKIPGLRILRCPMDDAILSQDEAQRALDTAERVVAELKAGRRVLVTCHQGRNRSGLVTALSLIGTYGMKPSAAISQIRQHRIQALTNRSFTDWLMGPEKQQKANRGGWGRSSSAIRTD